MRSKKDQLNFVQAGLGEEKYLIYEYSENIGKSTLKKVNVFRLIVNLIS